MFTIRIPKFERFPIAAFAILTIAVPVAAGGSVSGHVRDQNGKGLQGVDIDVFDASTGKKLVTPNDTTGVGGSFSIVIPSGKFRIAFDPSGVVGGGKVAPKELADVTVGAPAMDLGNIVLSSGIIVSGKFSGPGGQGVPNADLDLINSATLAKIYTPNDNTDAQGNFSFVAPTGNYYVQYEPPVELKLVAVRTGPIQMTSNTQLATVTAQSGAWLSGLVSTGGGVPIANIDIDIKDTATGLPVQLVGDLTDASGHYKTVVPFGTLNITFRGPLGSPFADEVFSNFAVAGDAVINAMLDSSAASDPTPTTVAFNTKFLGSFTSGAEIDELRFTGVAGELVTVDAKKKTGAAIPAFDLFAPSGAPVSLTSVSKAGALGTKVTKLALPETGEYRLLIYPISGAAGDYTAKITVMIPLALRSLKFAGAIDAPAGTVDIAFEAANGCKLSGKVAAPAGGLAPAIETLLSPSGAEVSLTSSLKAAKSSVTIAAPGIVLDETGTWTARAGGLNNSTGTFTATLKISYPKDAPAVVAEP